MFHLQLLYYGRACAEVATFRSFFPGLLSRPEHVSPFQARLLARTSDFQRQLSSLGERLLTREEEAEGLREDLDREEGLRALKGDAAVDMAVRRVKSAAKAQMRQLARQLEAAMKEAAESKWLKQRLQEEFQDTWDKLQVGIGFVGVGLRLALW
jgi:hypothetical protein